MDKKPVKLIIILLIIISLILVASYYIIIELNKTESKAEMPEEIIFDNRISPIEPQGLTVEIFRIRHRDILNEIFKISYRWSSPPSSYWIATVDGKEGSSEGNIGYGSAGIFTERDTMLKDCRVNFKVEDGQETSDVIITIMERKSLGLLGLRSQDVPIEEMQVKYDYKTGHWEGNDYLKDSDGYGHFLGENVEIWFNIYQADYDHDGIPYWTEVNVLFTDPRVDDSKLDPDYDGIPTSWEWKWGYDPNTWDDHHYLDPDIDGIENIEEYYMRKWFANPFQPDVYVETDGMQKKNFLDVSHVFHKDAQQMLIERYAQHGINLYIDDGWPDGPINGGGELLPFIKEFDEVSGGQVSSFYKHHFADERKGIFRYIIIANKLGWNTPSEYNKYDTILIFSGRRAVIERFFAVTPRLKSILMAKAVLHELGHSMGLLPFTFPGNDLMPPASIRYPSMPEDEYNEYLKQYHSIMNYKYIYSDRDLVDYSDGDNGPPYDQNDWEHLYLPAFQSDARAYEEPVDETFEDFEVWEEEVYPEIKGWNLTLNFSLSNNLQSLVYSDLNIENDILLLIANDKELDRDVKVYARPKIDPFPVVQSWSLVAEGKLDSESNEIQFYSFSTNVDTVLEAIENSS